MIRLRSTLDYFDERYSQDSALIKGLSGDSN